MIISKNCCHSPCGSVDWNISYSTEGRQDIVNPLAGVWIEIAGMQFVSLGVDVTPLAGVWIEIDFLTALFMPEKCHSPCGSVDWNSCIPLARTDRNVTPLAGVWIEINVSPGLRTVEPSLPLRECGLKLESKPLCWPMQCHSPCGSVDWNSLDEFAAQHNAVTPLAGVWIEIRIDRRPLPDGRVTPLAGVWIEIFSGATRKIKKKSLPLRECGLKCSRNSSIQLALGHSPCGSVDWNILYNS